MVLCVDEKSQIQALETAIKSYLEITNQSPKPFVWMKTADEILDSLRAILCADFRVRT